MLGAACGAMVPSMAPISINLRLTPELHERLKQRAGEQGVSLNTLILLLLTKGLENGADIQEGGS